MAIREETPAVIPSQFLTRLNICLCKNSDALLTIHLP